MERHVGARRYLNQSPRPAHSFAQQDVIDLDSRGRTDWSSYRTALPSEDGRYLHMVYTDYDDYITELTPDRLYNPRYDRVVGNDWKYNLHYVKIDLEAGEVINAEGEVLRTPIDLDYSKEKCLIWDTEGRGAGIPPVIALEAGGKPTFLHLLSEGDLKTHGYYYVRRENGDWLQFSDLDRWAPLWNQQAWRSHRPRCRQGVRRTG